MIPGESTPLKAKNTKPARLTPSKFVKAMANGHRITMPTMVTTKLTLKAVDDAEFLLTRTTDKPEATAESRAKMMPIIKFHFHFIDGSIKTNHPKPHFLCEK